MSTHETDRRAPAVTPDVATQIVLTVCRVALDHLSTDDPALARREADAVLFEALRHLGAGSVAEAYRVATARGCFRHGV